MGDTWVTDMRHYLDADGCLAAALPGPALGLVLFLGSIVGWVSTHEPGSHEQTNVPCRRSPGRRRCVGDIFADLEPDGAIRWECLICGDNGWIRGWQDTEWDRRGES